MASLDRLPVKTLNDRGVIELIFLHECNDLLFYILCLDFENIFDLLASKLEKILEHLVNNAVKVSPQHGTVEVGVEATEKDLVFSVRDQGPGVPRETQTLIFDSFRQADGSATRSLGGVGLGLTITRRLVELHGGRIWLESADGQGSCFFVSIPRELRPGAVLDERSPA